MTPLASKLFPFLSWRDRVTRATLRADLLAGLIGAMVVLPQAVAFATLAGMPPEYGLYCAMLPVAVAALWGSSWHQMSGPTNTISLAIFATMAPLAAPGSPGYVKLVLTLALIVGLIQLAMGLARLGTLVNFISHTVIVGFTAGAGLLIIAAQIRNFFGIPIPAGAHFFESLRAAVTHAGSADPWIIATSVATLAAAVAARRLVPRVPYMIVAMIAGSVFAYGLAVLGKATVPTIGTLPSGFPPLSLPSFDPADWRRVAPAALALTVLALAQAVSVARAVALRTGQRIDGNQEFIGQGLSNIVGAFASGYPSSGSFNRVWLNFEAGAKTPLAAASSAAFLLVIVLAVAPLGAHLPLAVMAAMLVVVALGLIDVAEVRRIVRTSPSEALVLVVTFLSTLALQLEFAIFLGVLTSLLRLPQPHDAPATDAGRALTHVGAAPIRAHFGNRRARVPAARDAARRWLAFLRRGRSRPRRTARIARIEPAAAPSAPDRQRHQLHRRRRGRASPPRVEARARSRRRALPLQSEACGPRSPRRAADFSISSVAIASSTPRTRRSARSTRGSTVRSAGPARRESSTSASRCCRTGHGGRHSGAGDS